MAGQEVGKILSQNLWLGLCSSIDFDALFSM